ncbi:hypothetical protein BJV77DRAFT_1008152 [Russula vinacea]|nr:hypothetical protein BJV77DRAFT_1008152 [Russula vinacea]
MFSHSTAISPPVPPNLNTTLSTPYYDSSLPNTAYPSSHPEMPRGPRSLLDVHEQEDVSSDEDFGQGPEGASNSSVYTRGRGPPKTFFASKPRELFRPKPQETVSASEPSELPCKVCRRLSPRNEVKHLGGFCPERHKWDWEKMEFPCELCKHLTPRSVLERWGGFCSERHWQSANHPRR